jgi:hypothetical protein
LSTGVLNTVTQKTTKGKTITTHVKPGGSVIWKLDKNPGITEITNITIKGDAFILKEKPRKVDFDHWEAVGADMGEGELNYLVEVEKVEASGDDELLGR